MRNDTRIELASLHAGLLTKHRAGDYTTVLEESEAVLRKMLLAVYQTYFEDLDSEGKRTALKTIKDTPDLPDEPAHYDLLQFAELFSQTMCLSSLARSRIAEPLSGTFDLFGIASLVREVNHASGTPDYRLLRIAAQQVLQLCTLLAFLLDVIDLDESDFLDGKVGVESDTPLDSLERLNFVKKFFLFNEERGLLLNAADRTRNVAFKVETFGRLLTNVYKGMLKDVDKDGRDTAEKSARLVVQDAGRDAGSRFGKALNREFQLQGSTLSLKERIAEWCSFDSMVGFGRFDSSTISVEPGTNEISGAIQLHENFLTVGRTWKDENICCFMKGYIWGVLEELTGVPIIISHIKDDCGQFTLGSDTCFFKASVNDAEYAKQKEEIDKIDLSEEL